MKNRISAFVAMAAVALCATVTQAQWFARGDFNGWDTSLAMTETALGSGHWVGTANGLIPGDRFDFKIATSDWSASAPAGNNARVVADAAGEITFHFYPGAQGDGWEPTFDRVGYDDPGVAWDLMGSFNGWSTPADFNAVGGGVYQVDVAMTAGTQEFKFRRAGDWDYSFGQTFEWNGANATFNAPADDTYRVTLDLPGGRWTVGEVPEPATLGVLGLAGLAALSRRRRD